MSSKQFTAQVFAWLHQVNADRDLPASAAKVAIYLASCFNEADGGAAWPAVETIGTEIGRSPSVVLDALRRLAARGHLKAYWGRQGRGHSGRYWMILKLRTPEVSNLRVPSVATTFPASHASQIKLRFWPQKTSEMAPQNFGQPKRLF
jgi:hypothetical protein